MIIRRIHLSLLLLAAFAFCLTGCSSNPQAMSGEQIAAQTHDTGPWWSDEP